MDRLNFEKDYWDKAASDPKVKDKFMCSIKTFEFLSVITPYLKRGCILELGCGIGRLLNKIKLSGCQFYGVDISNKLLDLAAKEGKAYLKLCDGRSIPFDDNFFNSVYSVLLFQHLLPETVSGYIKEVSRVLKVGGVFRFQFIEGTEREPLSNHYDFNVICGWLRTAGFKIINFQKGLVHSLWTWVTVVKQGDLNEK